MTDRTHQALIDAGAIYIGEWLSKKWYEASSHHVMVKCQNLYDSHRMTTTIINGFPDNWRIETGLKEIENTVRRYSKTENEWTHWYTTKKNIQMMRSWGCFENEDPSIVD